LLFIEEFGLERKEGMTQFIDLYRTVSQTCRNRGIPWMFWRLGQRKDNNTWSINSDDAVWQQVVMPEAKLINQTKTQDAWNVNVISGISTEFKDFEQVNKLKCYPNPFNATIRFTLQTSEQRVNFKIFNLQGKMVFQELVYPVNNLIDYQWNGQSLAGESVSSGLYIVIFEDKNQLNPTKICYVK
jgi:hypothetical protein